MRPAQKAPENTSMRLGDLLDSGASMRPAQKAPENLWAGRAAMTAGECFNEAGAKSAGKPLEFNSFCGGPCIASMRPAQKAPENRNGRASRSSPTSCFNEAGAKSAGKPYAEVYESMDAMTLQ